MKISLDFKVAPTPKLYRLYRIFVQFILVEKGQKMVSWISSNSLKTFNYLGHIIGLSVTKESTIYTSARFLSSSRRLYLDLSMNVPFRPPQPFLNKILQIIFFADTEDLNFELQRLKSLYFSNFFLRK